MIFSGNWVPDEIASGADVFTTAPGLAGDFTWRIGAQPGPPSGYSVNHKWVNNLFEGQFGNAEGATGYNAYGDGVEVHDSVFTLATDPCRYASSSSSPWGTDCTSVSMPEVVGVNDTWENNTVSAQTHGAGYSRVMPTLFGTDEWPLFSVQPSATPPFVGPEMGDPDTTSECLPAWERFNGGC